MPGGTRVRLRNMSRALRRSRCLLREASSWLTCDMAAGFLTVLKLDGCFAVSRSILHKSIIML